MTEAKASEEGGQAPPQRDARERVEIPETLRPAAKRLRRMRSAWTVLAPCCPATGAREIAEAEFSARRQFSQLARLDGGPDAESVRLLSGELDDLARAISGVAFDAPIERLQETLPQALGTHEQRLLDLLDLLAVSTVGEPRALEAKLGAVDYLVTLLCSEHEPGGRAGPRDPVTLTNVMRRLCERVESACQGDPAEPDTSYFDTGNPRADRSNPVELGELRKRKAKLGLRYFAPAVLRTVVSYNLALPEISQGSTHSPATTGEPSMADTPAADSSVFGSTELRPVFVALQRRLSGEAAEAEPISRIAWALDIDGLTAAERTALRDGRLDSSDLQTGVVFVGLLLRGLSVLGGELQEIGIDPEVVRGRWLEELDELITIEVNDAIKHCTEGAAYEKACKLTGLRNRFLGEAGTVRRKARGDSPRPRESSTEQETREFRREARTLAGEAVVGKNRPEERRPGVVATLRNLPWRQVAPGAIATGLVIVIALQLLGVIDILQRDLDRWNHSELAAVSEHLVRGHRNGGGSGAAFVGTLGEDWLALPPAERDRAAAKLVSSLRDRGVVQVMIYDGDRQLRIQALGETIRSE